MIAIIGAGRVGSGAALRIVEREIDDVVLVDIVEGRPMGEALDIMEASRGLMYDTRVTGSTDYSSVEGADLVVITAGLARKPGMSRLDLMNTNAGIMREITKNVMKYAPEAKLMIVTNPVDVMTHVALEASGKERTEVFGMGSMLDKIRFEYFLSEKLDISIRDVNALVVGEHGDSMVPLPRYSSAGGIPVTQLLEQGDIDDVVERTRKGGAEVISLKGATFFAPSAALANMVEAFVRDQRRVLPASVCLRGEYGVDGVCMGTPSIIGRHGVERIIDLKFNSDELEKFHRSAAVIRDAMERGLRSSLK